MSDESNWGIWCTKDVPRSDGGVTKVGHWLGDHLDAAKGAGPNLAKMREADARGLASSLSTKGTDGWALEARELP